MSDSETVTGTAPREGEERPVPWFYRIEPSDDPWRNWFAMLDFPHHGPLDAELERDVEALCLAADRRRMATDPTTKHFATMWATFRGHHVRLEDNWKYRRTRYLVWRAAALKVIHEGHWGQDSTDRLQVRNKLGETMTEFGPYAFDGSDRAGNFWKVTMWPNEQGKLEPDSLAEYAVIVLSLVRAAAESKGY